MKEPVSEILSQPTISFMSLFDGHELMDKNRMFLILNRVKGSITSSNMKQVYNNSLFKFQPLFIALISGNGFSSSFTKVSEMILLVFGGS